MNVRDTDDDAPAFERTPNTKHGKGSHSAVNRGRVKRQFKGSTVRWKRNGSKHRG